MTSEKKTNNSDRSGGGNRVKVMPWTRSRQLERDLEHVNREIYRRNLELAQTNKTLALLQAIDNLVLNEAEDEDLEPLATKLCQEVVEAGYGFVAILGNEQAGAHELDMLGWHTASKMPEATVAVLRRVKLRTGSSWFKDKSTLRFINLDDVPISRLAYYCHGPEATILEFQKFNPVKAVCCIKLNAPQHLVGVMVVGFTEYQQDGLSESDAALFTRLGEAIGIALDHKLLLAENQRVLAQLKKTNARLRVLDRTKDDFISMASHQLRTPLTSVRGYVSMVLDGDGGKINDTQRKLLTQSFLSSQRMVYLISDLLNVSRLRTGKFIIEPVESNLAKVIEEEVEQLTETVKGRGLELTYHKPEQFPVLLVDETKLRQVIMNFIDNAIYYTPPGGHIDIYLTEKPASIEFTVVDDGIGVPRHEQHHLFTKFFRAHNARSARPDGTGLGLFMAKKVIIAQGGAVIFKSTEGRGSTFGFTFPKAKLLPKSGTTTAATTHQVN